MTDPDPREFLSGALAVDIGEVRGALGCGDVARAAFVAALGRIAPPGQPLTQPLLVRAAVFAAAVGKLKLKFFSNEDFFSVLYAL